MVKHIYCILLLLSPCALISQTTISGVVSDNKKEKLPGANILLENTYDGATSDADGNFSFTTDETGKQVLLVTFVGYEEYRDTIDLQSGALQLNIV